MDHVRIASVTDLVSAIMTSSPGDTTEVQLLSAALHVISNKMQNWLAVELGGMILKVHRSIIQANA